MGRLTIAGLIAALTLGNSVVVAFAQPAPFWPNTTGTPVFSEWYSDLPWHQKLGTTDGNEIDTAIVLPYAALGTAEQAYCATNKLSQAACMIETGIVNVLGILRTDTPYDTGNNKIRNAPECQTGLSCIEVKLALSSFWTRSAGGNIALQPRVFGTEPPTNPYGANYGGYVITDGSSYAPQMPWYMAHYCDSPFPGNADVQDPVCYADYFSPMNNGFALLPATDQTNWPRSQPWSVFPPAPAPPAVFNHCKPGQTACTLAMAGFNLSPVPNTYTNLQYWTYNNFLLTWFNGALAKFPTSVSPVDLQRHFPWSGNPVSWDTFLYPQAVNNPFLGQFAFLMTAPANPLGPPPCDVTVTGPTRSDCKNTAIERASTYLYPRQCTLADLAGGNVANLRQCGLNYELHHNGYLDQWPDSFWLDLNASGMLGNQYGRTSFLFAGIPGMQMPVSFYKDPSSASGLSIYEQVHNASLFSLYLPIANEADAKNAFRNYGTDFYHTLLMSNHMESDPNEFAEGIRGKVLWHDEYRTQKMYNAYLNLNNQKFSPVMFAAAFSPTSAPAPFHNNTCDGCHLRNGSGVPINTAGTLDVALQEFMTAAAYNPYVVKDYTFTGQIRPMKLVFFDLKRVTTGSNDSVYSEPLAFSPGTVQIANVLYNNKIMNFYGDSFHVTRPGYNYSWNYVPATSNRLVVSTARVNSELGTTYQPWQVSLGEFQTDKSCQLVVIPPSSKPWPARCEDIDSDAIHKAINDGEVGFLLLNGKRLGNLGAIEAIPNAAILGFRQNQVTALGANIAGEILWNAGSRGGVDGTVHKVCATKTLTDCFIGRFGWLGDRVSLEDQVANAAFVEMNMTTSAGYQKLYSNGTVMFPIRYNFPNCGAADLKCVQSKGNADLSERDVERMADYARWIGNPTRSEFTVTLPEVIAGEKIFQQLQCNTCHVISKINIVNPDDTMLSKAFHDRMATHVAPPVYPFLSYLGTDLLMHDMGYLSQVGTPSQCIKEPITCFRDQNGVVLPAFHDFVQKIRTPALKGLRFNRFVTDSFRNTKNPTDPACDFLLHDGRACDAIEAAFLHDGPAIKKLGVIAGLNALTAQQLLQLRAFLYSL
jgi:CxxC motif-containing protein (DUF1111 family)